MDPKPKTVRIDPNLTCFDPALTYYYEVGPLGPDIPWAMAYRNDDLVRQQREPGFQALGWRVRNPLVIHAQMEQREFEGRLRGELRACLSPPETSDTIAADLAKTTHGIDALAANPTPAAAARASASNVAQTCENRSQESLSATVAPHAAGTTSKASIDGVPEDVVNLVAVIKSLNRRKGHPMRAPLQNHGLRQHFNGRGLLKAKSPLSKFRGDLRLFTQVEWDFLVGSTKANDRPQELQQPRTRFTFETVPGE